MRLLGVALLALLCGCKALGPFREQIEPGLGAREAERRAAELMTAPRPSVDDLLVQGDRLRDGGDVSQAAWTYLKAMRLDPTRKAPAERIGYLHLAKGDTERAESMFAAVLEVDPNSAPALTGRGLAELRRGNLEAARIALLRAMELDPKSQLPPLAMGLVCDWSDQGEEARRYYARAIELAPVGIEAANNLGVSYFLSGDYAQAERQLRRAIELDPKEPAHHNNLALTLAELGRLDEALVEFRVAGGEAVAQNNLGYLYYRRGDYENAIRHYELALEATPVDALPIVRNLRRAEEDLRRRRAPTPAAEPTPAPEPPPAATAPTTP
jgi:Flp pilus assembly protein TadD